MKISGRFILAAFTLTMVSCFADNDTKQVPAKAPPAQDPRMAMVLVSLRTIPADPANRILARIRQAPDAFFALAATAAEESAAAGGLLLLVDKQHPLPQDFVPADLVSLNNYPLSLSRQDLSLRRSILPAVLALSDAAKAAGVSLLISSSYRSWDYQKSVYERNVRESGQAEADRVSAKPGNSQHQLGTAIDLGPIDDSFAETAAGAWMQANAWRFGFSLSYPSGYESLTGYKWESWHYRYLGKAAARIEREYFEGIQQYFLLFWKAYGGS